MQGLWNEADLGFSSGSLLGEYSRASYLISVSRLSYLIFKLGGS